MAEVTQASIAEQIREMLNENWAIHVDEKKSYQIPEKPQIRRGKMVTGFMVYICLWKPVYLSVFLHAATLPKLKKRIDDGDLWAVIKAEFESKASEVTPEQWAALGVKQPSLRGRQLALTHR